MNQVPNPNNIPIFDQGLYFALGYEGHNEFTLIPFKYNGKVSYAEAEIETTLYFTGDDGIRHFVELENEVSNMDSFGSKSIKFPESVDSVEGDGRYNVTTPINVIQFQVRFEDGTKKSQYYTFQE